MQSRYAQRSLVGELRPGLRPGLRRGSADRGLDLQPRAVSADAQRAARERRRQRDPQPRLRLLSARSRESRTLERALSRRGPQQRHLLHLVTDHFARLGVANRLAAPETARRARRPLELLFAIPRARDARCRPRAGSAAARLCRAARRANARSDSPSTTAMTSILPSIESSSPRESRPSVMQSNLRAKNRRRRRNNDLRATVNWRHGDITGQILPRDGETSPRDALARAFDRARLPSRGIHGDRQMIFKRRIQDSSAGPPPTSHLRPKSSARSPGKAPTCSAEPSKATATSTGR